MCVEGERLIFRQKMEPAAGREEEPEAGAGAQTPVGGAVLLSGGHLQVFQPAWEKGELDLEGHFKRPSMVLNSTHNLSRLPHLS